MLRKKIARGRVGVSLWTPFLEKNFQTNIAHNNFQCAYNLYVKFHCNQIIIVECCFRGSLNMGPVDPQNGS